MEIVRLTGDLPDYLKVLPFMPGKRNSHTSQKLMLLEGREAAGYVSFSVSYGVLDLELIYVMPIFRRKGFATKALKDVAGFGRELECTLMTADVMESQSNAAEFLRSCGFTLSEGSGSFSFSLSEAIQSDYLQKILYKTDRPGEIKPLSSLNRRESAEVLSFLTEQEYDIYRLEAPGYMSSLSLCAYFPKGALKAVIICFRFGDSIVIDFLAGKLGASLPILFLLRALLETLIKAGLEEKTIVFQAENEKAQELAQKLLQERLTENDRVMHGFLVL